MIIDLARMCEDGELYEGEQDSESLSLLMEDEVQEMSPVGYSLKAMIIDDELIVRGKLAARVCFSCSRCLEGYICDISDGSFNFSCELDKDQESVDLTPQIREAMILAFPSYPVCASDCKGLCAHCGKNLNKLECNCEKPTDGRWTALDGLNVD